MLTISQVHYTEHCVKWVLISRIISFIGTSNVVDSEKDQYDVKKQDNAIDE